MVLKLIPRTLVALTILAVAAAFVGDTAVGAVEGSYLEDWESAEGFSLERIAEGLELPTAVAVSETVDGTWFLVTELRGAIKSISAEGQVDLFTTVETIRPGVEYPDVAGESGLAGICIDEDRGHVFVTHTNRDGDGILRNFLRRFDLGPRGVTAPPVSETDISGELPKFRSALSHQIGGCEVNNESLFVSVGDGWDVNASGDPEALLGKVLRVKYDGAPAEGNPFIGTGGTQEYVWAFGLRNPFGIDIVDDQVIVSQNGPSVDSLVRVDRGMDYFWDGTDESVALNSLYVWTSAVSPVHIVFADASAPNLPEEWRRGFYVAISGNIAGDSGVGVQFIPYDPETHRATGTPRWVVRQTGPGSQAVSGVAIDGEGLVFTALLPGSDGVTGLYRLRFDPKNALANTIGASTDAGILREFGCLSCHRYQGEGGNVGPALDATALRYRMTDLFTEEYERATQELDSLSQSPWVDYRDAREEVLNAEGDDRTLTWLKYRIMEPRFDRIDAQMPTLGINEADAEHLAGILFRPSPWWRAQLSAIFDTPQNAFWFAGGAAVMAVATIVAGLIVFVGKRFRRRKRQSAIEQQDSGT